MKPKDDIHKLIKKLHIDTSTELDRKVYNDISEATVAGPAIWEVITRGGAMKLTVAAAVIIAFGIGFFIGQRSKATQPVIYSQDVTCYMPSVSAKTAEDSFWQQKVAAAMQPRPYLQSQFDKVSLIDAYKQYLKEKHYD
jgi:hypothetical protein